MLLKLKLFYHRRLMDRNHAAFMNSNESLHSEAWKRYEKSREKVQELLDEIREAQRGETPSIVWRTRKILSGILWFVAAFCAVKRDWSGFFSMMVFAQIVNPSDED